MPSGLKNLATLGKLYESEAGFSKKVNSQEYKEKTKNKQTKKEDKDKNERLIEKA
jgi:hypothetical protein